VLPKVSVIGTLGAAGAIVVSMLALTA